MGRKKEIPGKLQFGFYINTDGDELRLRPKTGDKMIRPEAVPKKKVQNPFDELTEYNHELEDWKASVGEVRVVNDNGGITIYDVGLHGLFVSRVGEDGEAHYVESDLTPKPSFNNLSQKAKGLYWAMKNQEKK